MTHSFKYHDKYTVLVGNLIVLRYFYYKTEQIANFRKSACLSQYT